MDHPRLKLSGWHSCPEGPTSPRHHISIDWITFWANTICDPGDALVDDLAGHWESMGYLLHDHRHLRFLRQRKPWGLRCSDGAASFDFRAFSPIRENVGFYRQMRLVLPSAALTSNAGGDLYRTFMAPWLREDAEASTRRVSRTDIAFDVEVPHAAVLAYRDLFPASKRTKRDRYGEKDWSFGPARVSANYVGLPGAPLRWRIYDKFQQVIDTTEWTIEDIQRGTVPGLAHLAGWQYCTRIEAQVSPNGLVKGIGYDAQLLAHLPSPLAALHLIDLRRVERSDPWLYFMLAAKVTSVDDVSWRIFGQSNSRRRAFRSALASCRHTWQALHPADAFAQQRGPLQRSYAEIFS